MRERDGLSAGGRWIRTIGPCREEVGFRCGRRIAGMEGGHPERGVSFTGYRWFESMSLQRGVRTKSRCVVGIQRSVPRRYPPPFATRGREMLWGGRQRNGNFVAASNRWSAPMPQPNDLSRSLVALDQNSTIIAVIEMSQSSWLVGGVLPGIERQCAAPGAGEERAETARHYTPRRNSIMAAFTSATRSCWVQWPQPGNIIVARSADTKFERFGISPSMPGKLTTGSRSPAM